MNRKKMYLAAGWFNQAQDEELTRLEQIMEERSTWIDMTSPRRIFICPPNASREVQDATYHGNLQHIRDADFLIVNTRDKDLGTIMECGYATAFNKHIIYFCAGLPKGAKFNLMLSRSGAKVCTSFEDLEDYLERCYTVGELLVEPYDKEIE
jgi:nucleoside 2-deoxyribosyltransferase